MNTSALVLMLFTTLLVTGMVIYFLIKVLKTPPKAEPDSYLDNDDDERPSKI
ncbi:MAG: hypothetical protein ABJN84_12300 [Flavobacteriaceae bacterium]